MPLACLRQHCWQEHQRKPAVLLVLSFGWLLTLVVSKLLRTDETLATTVKLVSLGVYVVFLLLAIALLLWFGRKLLFSSITWVHWIALVAVLLSGVSDSSSLLAKTTLPGLSLAQVVLKASLDIVGGLAMFVLAWAFQLRCGTDPVISINRLACGICLAICCGIVSSSGILSFFSLAPKLSSEDHVIFSFRLLLDTMVVLAVFSMLLEYFAPGAFSSREEVLAKYTRTVLSTDVELAAATDHEAEERAPRPVQPEWYYPACWVIVSVSLTCVLLEGASLIVRFIYPCNDVVFYVIGSLSILPALAVFGASAWHPGPAFMLWRWQRRPARCSIVITLFVLLIVAEVSSLIGGQPQEGALASCSRSTANNTAHQYVQVGIDLTVGAAFGFVSALVSEGDFTWARTPLNPAADVDNPFPFLGRPHRYFFVSRILLSGVIVAVGYFSAWSFLASADSLGSAIPDIAEMYYTVAILFVAL